MARIIIAQLVRRALTAFIQGIRDSIDAAREFEIRVSELRTISQQNQLAFEEWAQGVRELSDAFGLPILDQTEAAYQTLSNQVAKGAETFDFLRESNKFALAAVTSSTDAVNLLTAALNSFGLDASETERAASVLFKTIELGRVRASEMANSFGDVAILANQLGITLEELGAAISTITIQGVKYNKVATQLRGIFIKLLKPTKEMKQFFEDLGVATGEEAIEVFGLGKLLEILQERTKGQSTELAKLINRIRGISGALALTGKGLEIFEANLKANREALDSYRKAVEISFESSGRTITIELNKVKNFFTQEFGRVILKEVATFSKDIGGLTPILKGVATTIRDLLIPAVVALTAKLIILAASNPWTALLTGVTLLAAGFNIAVNAAIARAEELREAAEKARQARVEAERNAVKAVFKIISDSVRARLRLAAGLNAKLIAIESRRIKEQFELIEFFRKENKKLNDEFIKGVKENIKTLDDEIKKARENALQLFEDTKQAFKEQEKIEFEFRLEGLDIKDQIKALQVEIKRLGDVGVDLFELGDIEGARAVLKERIKLQDRIIKIAKDAAKEQGDISKDLAELDKKQAKELLEANKKIVEADTDKKRQKAIEDRNELIDEQVDDLDALLQRALKIKGVDTDINGIIKQRRKLLEENAKARQAIIDQEKKRAEELKKQRIIEAELLDELLEVNRAVRDFDLAEALAAKDAKTVTDLLGQQVANLRKQNELRTALGAQAKNNASIDQEALTLETLRTNLLKRLDLRARGKALRDEITAQQKAIELEGKRVSTDAASVQKIKERIGVTLKDLEIARKLTNDLLERGDVDESRLKLLDEAIALSKKFTGNLKEEFKTAEDVTKSADRLKEIFKELAKTDVFAGKVAQRGLGFSQDDIKVLDKFDIGLINTVVSNARELARIFDVIEKRAAVEKIATQFANATKELLKMEKPIKDSTRNLQDTGDAALTVAQRLEIMTQKLKDFTVEAKKALIEENIAGIVINTPDVFKVAPELNKAKGGMIRTHGKDTVPALLSPGEFVVNERATRRFFSQLVSMNSGSIPKFAEGGSVTNVGDVNITLQSTGSESVDIVKIGKGLRRAIRQGRVRL